MNIAITCYTYSEIKRYTNHAILNMKDSSVKQEFRIDLLVGNHKSETNLRNTSTPYAITSDDDDESLHRTKPKMN